MILFSIEPKLSDIYILVVKGDRLDILADRYYKKSSLWKIIAIANNIGLGTLFVQESMQLRIPMEIDEIVQKIK